MQTLKKTNRRVYILVTLGILLINAALAWYGSVLDWQKLRQTQEERVQDIDIAFEIALETVANDMEQIAMFLANSDMIQGLFLLGKKNVELEGGGKGGVKADNTRKILLRSLREPWEVLTQRYKVRQLHFHLAPGDLSFLRVHEPDMFGDRLDTFRPMIVDANKARLPLMGVELGKFYPGIRGVVPVFAMDYEVGSRVHVGAVEAGTSFTTILRRLNKTFDSFFAILIRPSKYGGELEGWTNLDERSSWIIEEDTAPQGRALLLLPPVLELLESHARTYTLLLNHDPPLAVMSLPIPLYGLDNNNPDAPQARLLAWCDITPDITVYKRAVILNASLALLGTALVLGIFLLSWHYLKKHLATLVKERTLKLQSTKQKLEGEVAERKQVEETLRKREAQYRSFFEDNACAMLFLDPIDCTILDANNSASRFYGYSLPALREMDIHHINPMNQDDLKDMMVRTLDGSGRYEFKHRLASGELRDVEVYSGPFDFHGKRALFSIIHDITEREKARTQLTQTLEEMEAIFENSQVSVILLSQERIFQRVNQRFVDVFGYRREEAIGKSVSLIHASRESFALFGKTYYHEFQDGALHQLEYPLRTKDGRTLHCLLSGKTISPKGLGRGTLWVIDDISALKEAERLRQDVERIMRHDLKTPLNGLMGLPQVLLLDDNLTEEQRDTLRDMSKTAEHMLYMVNLSLDLYKMETGAYTPTLTAFNLLGELRRALNDLGLVLRSKKLSVRLQRHGKEITLTENHSVYAEPPLCYTVLANILKNACEAAPDESAITITLGMVEGFARTSIHNLGAVPVEMRNRFFQKYASVGKKGGTGLGTYSARLAVEVMGGRLFMHTDDDAGTTLHIDLPQPAQI